MDENTSGSQSPPAETVELGDARALRAYAHPLRLRLIGLLRTRGPLTATRAAQLLGESSGTTSFHLRQLAKYGLVEEAGGGTGRQKPWRATALFTAVPELAEDDEHAAAGTLVRTVLATRHHEKMLDWITRRTDEPASWQRAAPFSDYLLYLTAAELEDVSARIDTLLRDYTGRNTDPAARPDGARLVTYLNVAMPEPADPA